MLRRGNLRIGRRAKAVNIGYAGTTVPVFFISVPDFAWEDLLRFFVAGLIDVYEVFGVRKRRCINVSIY